MHFESVVQSADMTQEASMTPLSASSPLSPAPGADCSGDDCVSPCGPGLVELHVCACYIWLHHCLALHSFFILSLEHGQLGFLLYLIIQT